MPVKRAIVVFRYGQFEDDCFCEVFSVDRFWYKGLTPEGRGRTLSLCKGKHDIIVPFVSGMRMAGAEVKVAQMDDCPKNLDITDKTWQEPRDTVREVASAKRITTFVPKQYLTILKWMSTTK